MRFWFLRVHRDVCRQNDLLHKQNRKLTADLNRLQKASRNLQASASEAERLLVAANERITWLQEELADLRRLHGWLEMKEMP